MQYITNVFGQVYGSCSFGSSTYQNSTCQTATGGTTGSGGTSSSSTSGGVLTNTGFDIVLIVTLACVIALVAVLVRFWKRPSQTS